MGDEQHTIAENEQLARLRLIRSPGIGPATFQQLLARNGSATQAISYILSERKNAKLAGERHILDELDQLQHMGAQLIFHGTRDYPDKLAAIPDAPPVLSVKGDLSLLGRPNIGVVGARNASAAGIKLTKRICAELSSQDFIVTSGLARGVDTAAHIAALGGGTIACIAGGLDYIYPRENKELHEKIADIGLIVSEMPLGTKPQARHFPRRNRIISGLSDGLLIVEAAKKSGSLITARYAAEHGREVFAVPGSPLDPRAQGTNQLIKDGAVLTQSADDIITELSSMPLLRAPMKTQPTPVATSNGPHVTPIPVKQPEPKFDSLLTMLSPSPIHIDEIVRLSGQPTETILSEFLSLELAGEIIRHSGNRFSRISNEK